jgi:hypothetical protein
MSDHIACPTCGQAVDPVGVIRRAISEPATWLADQDPASATGDPYESAKHWEAAAAVRALHDAGFAIVTQQAAAQHLIQSVAQRAAKDWVITCTCSTQFYGHNEPLARIAYLRHVERKADGQGA